MDNFVERLKNISPERRLYFIEMLPKDLAEAGKVDKLSQVLTDLHFIEAKCAEGMTYDLISDYNAALDVLPEAQEEKQKEKKHQERVKQYTEDIIEYARKWSDARKKHKENPERYLIPKPEDILLPEIIPSVESWSEERIRKDTERIINNPT